MRRATRVIVLSVATVTGLVSLITGPAAAAPSPATAQSGADTTAAYGFAFVDQPTLPFSVANPRMTANRTGTNTVTRHGIGDYSVQMPGLGKTAGGNVQVTAYGDDANRCKSSYWLPSFGDMFVGVVCHNSAGNRVDSQFTVQFHRGSHSPDLQSAYLLADPPVTGTPDATHSYNSKGGNNHVTRLGTGVWRVNFGSGFTRAGGIVHVTAVGANSAFCTARGWGQSTADVRCYTASGQLTDTAWSLRYVDQHLPNGFGELGGYAWANQAGAPIGVPYVPHSQHSFNMNNGTNTVTHLGTGRYRVRFERIPAFDAGNPMVTSHFSEGVSCKVTKLHSSGSSSSVQVGCRNAAGALVDSMFTVSQVTNR